jgi:hypothetical protein
MFTSARVRPSTLVSCCHGTRPMQKARDMTSREDRPSICRRRVRRLGKRYSRSCRPGSRRNDALWRGTARAQGLPPATSSVGLLKDMAHLHFSQPGKDVACTVERLAHELSARLAERNAKPYGRTAWLVQLRPGWPIGKPHRKRTLGPVPPTPHTRRLLGSVRAAGANQSAHGGALQHQI